MHDDHDHSHELITNGGEPPSRHEPRALEELFVEKGVVDREDVRRGIDWLVSRSPADGARPVARAWVDPEFRERLLADARSAAREVGLDPGLSPVVVALENTDTVHHLVVRTLCSCYPRALLPRRPTGTRACPTPRARCPSRVPCSRSSAFGSATTSRCAWSTPRPDIRYPRAPPRHRTARRRWARRSARRLRHSVDLTDRNRRPRRSHGGRLNKAGGEGGPAGPSLRSAPPTRVAAGTATRGGRTGGGWVATGCRRSGASPVPPPSGGIRSRSAPPRRDRRRCGTRSAPRSRAGRRPSARSRAATSRSSRSTSRGSRGGVARRAQGERCAVRVSREEREGVGGTRSGRWRCSLAPHGRRRSAPTASVARAPRARSSGSRRT